MRAMPDDGRKARVPFDSTVDLGGEALQLLQSLRRIMFFWGVVMPIISGSFWFILVWQAASR